MELTTIDTNNYAVMAKAMGIANETSSQKSSSLPRLRISHSPIMGEGEVKGKKVNMEVIPAGAYRLEIPDGPMYYANSVKVRPYMQRYMYKRFVKGNEKTPNRYIKTLMADSLNMDLKDNDGGFNCGKPAGYIKDFNALPDKTKELIKQIKRVRVILGEVTLTGAVNDSGEEVSVDPSPFKLAKMQRLPIQHIITANTEERKLPNGNSFYVPVVSLDLSKTLDITETEHNMFSDFMSWTDNYNSYISSAWSEKANSQIGDDEMDIVDDLVDVETDEEEAA